MLSRPNSYFKVLTNFTNPKPKVFKVRPHLKKLSKMSGGIAQLVAVGALDAHLVGSPETNFTN